MTIREHLARQQNMLLLWTLASVLAFGAILWLEPPPARFNWLATLSLVSFACSLVTAAYLLRCPRCDGRLGRLKVPLTRRLFSFGKTVDFCPYCGVSLDASYDDTK